MKGRQGFTLMELLVVLLIIGILSTVALRTIDATRDRGLFDKTAKDMNTLVQAIVGNPGLSYDGRRVDFGYYGDMELLPPGNDLRGLLRNTTGSASWHGPYLHLTAGGDTASFLYDGWGHAYDYKSDSGTIHSGGNGKFPMTVNIVDDTSQLNHNMVAGTITDMNGDAPGDPLVSNVSVRFYYNNPAAHGGATYTEVIPNPGGYYEFSPTSPSPTGAVVPIGIHRLVAYAQNESLVRYVTVLPRSRTIVDFKFISSFWDKLKLVGVPRLDGSGKGFEFDVTNTQTHDDTVSSLVFLPTSVPWYMREDFRIGTDHDGFPLGPLARGKGPGDTISFTPLAVAPNGLVTLYFAGFYIAQQPSGTDTSFLVHNNTFEFRFSDGSEITVKP